MKCASVPKNIIFSVDKYFYCKTVIKLNFTFYGKYYRSRFTLRTHAFACGGTTDKRAGDTEAPDREAAHNGGSGQYSAGDKSCHLCHSSAVSLGDPVDMMWAVPIAHLKIKM